MGQSKIKSLREAMGNTAVGLLIAYVISFVVYPLLGMDGNAGTYALATGIFTGVSVARNYFVRRFFVTHDREPPLPLYVAVDESLHNDGYTEHYTDDWIIFDKPPEVDGNVWNEYDESLYKLRSKGL